MDTQPRHFIAVREVSRADYDFLPERIEYNLNDDLRRLLSQYVVDAQAIKKTTKYHHELRMELYVATPEEFWKMVKEEAEKIAYRGPLTPKRVG